MYNIVFLIVTYNGEKYIEKCISSIKNYCKDSKIIVVDNNSEDDTRSILKKLPIDDVILLKNNIGFGKANNIAFKRAISYKADLFFLINQDVYFFSGNFNKFIKIAFDNFKNNYFGIISPFHLAPNQKDFDFKFKDYISSKNTPHLLKDLENQNELSKVYASKSINAAAWLVSKETIVKVGLFDPIFHHYGEDTDYINRLKFHNFKIGVLPNFKVVHNRQQFENFNKDILYYKLKVWTLVHFKNINTNLISLFIKYLIYLYKRIKKNSGHFNLMYCKILIYAILNLKRITFSRRVCKRYGAFLNVD
ncbi:glycosyltransferase family 2 protein [Lutibacter aestuarii]|uniref:Glycosyltransferase family 2 protein n=1 Tax=Lutibacter aestuarii TaxID=861111 RepID=A0ABW2Z867_9FLAO